MIERTSFLFNEEHSASKLKKADPGLYDVFNIPLSEDTFVPNERLRRLKDEAATRVIDDKMNGSLHDLYSKLLVFESWKDPEDGAETNVNHSNLQSIITFIHYKCTNGFSDSFEVKALSSHETSLAKSCCSEYCVALKGSPKSLVVGSEAKGRAASNFECFHQALQIGGDIAIFMYDKGVRVEDAAVPVIVYFGDGLIQILGVYLIRDYFPVMVQLSELLDTNSFCQRVKISRWMLAIGDFITQSSDILTKTRRPAIARVKHDVSLFLSGYFFKPIFETPKSKAEGTRNDETGPSLRRQKLSRMMTIYEFLFRTPGSLSFILFPIGIMMMPSSSDSSKKSNRVKLQQRVFVNFSTALPDHTPLVIYELLSEEWTNERVPPDLSESYLRQLRVAVELLNSASIVHSDLRPANIMWRRQSDEVDIRLIDFEDALTFKSPFPIFDDDYRYPYIREYSRKGTFVSAGAIHNEYFLVAIELWLRENNEKKSFSNFMEKAADDIRAGMRQELLDCLIRL